MGFASLMRFATSFEMSFGFIMSWTSLFYQIMYAFVDSFSFGTMGGSFVVVVMVRVRVQVVVRMQVVQMRVQVVVVMVMVWVLLIMMWRENESRRGFFDASFKMFFQ